MAKKAVFLDRDGTIISNTGALSADPSVEPLPEAIEAVKKLRDAGFLIVVVTNQSGVARGFYTEDQLAVAHDALMRKFTEHGAPIDGLYLCPHHPNPDEAQVDEYVKDCNCRKPKPGLLLQAAQDMDIDLAASYMVGDAERDVEAGAAAGCRANVLIMPDCIDVFPVAMDGPPVWEQIMENMEHASESVADAVVPDVSVAADFILDMENADNG